MINQHNVVHTCEQLTRCYELALGDDDGVGPALHLVPADGPHRRTPLLALQRHAPRVHDHVLPGPGADRHLRPRGPSGGHVRRAPRVGEGLPRRQRRAGGRPGEEAEVRRGGGRRAADRRGPPARHDHRRAAGDVGLPRRRRLLHRARAGRARRAAPRHHRRGADPPPDPRVVQRARHPADRDLRHERDHGADDVGGPSRPHQARDRRPVDPRLRGQDRRGRRGHLPRRQRLPGLLQGARRRRPRR